jgi:hypothetical protein
MRASSLAASVRGLLILLVGVSLLAACSHPPEKERGQAEGAIAAARAASAETYAPDDLRAAEAALADYDTAVAQGDFRQALNAALTARDLAYEAVSRAGTARAEARGRAERLVTALEALAENIERRLSGATTPRITGTGAQRLRLAVAAASSSMQEARTAIEAERYPVAIVNLEAALAALQTEFDAVTRRARS